MSRCVCPQCGKSPLTYTDGVTRQSKIALHNDAKGNRCGGSHLTVEDANMMNATGTNSENMLLGMLVLSSLSLMVHCMRRLTADDEYGKACLSGAILAAEDACKGLALYTDSLKPE